jgi:hypothetical protein
VQPQPPGDDVAGHVRQPPVLRVSVSPEPGERRRRDVKLDREHAGGLVDLGAVQRQVRGLPVQPAPVAILPVVVRAAEQHHGRRVGEDEQVTELPVWQRAGRAAVQAQHPGADRPDGQRDREDRPGPELAGRRGERRPPPDGLRIAQVGGQDRRGRGQHVMARPLAQHQLSLGQLLAGRAGHAHHEIRVAAARGRHPRPAQRS